MEKNWIIQHSVLFIFLAGFVLTACAPLTQQPISTTLPAPISSPTLATPTEASSLPVTNPTLKALIVPTVAPGVGEAPSQVMDMVLKDLERRIGTKPENVNITRSEFVTWNDGSMGCPKRGMSYTMATIDGYWIVLQVNSKLYDYRISAKTKTVVLCEQ